MKKNYIIIGLSLSMLMFAVSCATNQHKSNALSTCTYYEAVSFLSTALVSEIKASGEDDKSIIIYNANVVNGEETKLEQRFIQDLENNLANLDVQIKRKEVFNSDITENNAIRVDCSQNQIRKESKLIIEFGIDECINGSNCADAFVRLITRATNTIKFAEKKTFQLTSRLSMWNSNIVTIQTIRGSRENPYKDFQEAAMHIFGKIVCIAKAIIDQDDLVIFIKGTTRTPQDLIASFSQSTSQHGVRQVLVFENWLNVALGARDQFQMVIYERSRQDFFQNTGLALGIDLRNIDNQLSKISVQLMTIDEITVRLDGEEKRINAGEAIPLCAPTGYVLNNEQGRRLSAIGTGVCSKKIFERGMWESSAKTAARMDAQAQLIEKVKNYIKGSTTIINGQLNNKILESSVRASISNAQLIWEKFDPKTCVAKAKYEIWARNIVIHSTDSQNTPQTSNYSHNYSRRNNHAQYSNNNTFASHTPAASQSSNVKRTYQRAQKNMIRFVQSDLRKRMKRDEINARIINMINIIGTIDIPRCRVDDNYVA